LKTCTEKSFSILQEREFSVLSFKAFGTSCEVKFSPINSHSPELISKEVVSWVNEFERRYSRYLPDSWLSQVNKSAGIAPVKLSRDDQPIIQAASFVYFQSQQTIDPSCLPLTQIWQNARASNVIPQESVVEDAKALVNWEKVQHTENEIFLPSPGMGLDFGGFGKEYAVDLISAKLRASNYGNFLVNFGGDIFASGYANDNCTWKVGIENPLGESNPSYVVSLSNTGLATSGNYRRYFDVDGKRYGHTIDQRTGYPTIHSQLTASVVSPSCLKSGIIATTSLLLGKEKGMRLLESEWNAEGCIQSFESTLITSKFYNYLIYENPA
jgi:thiamine biosynthesis lipoprotein